MSSVPVILAATVPCVCCTGIISLAVFDKETLAHVVRSMVDPIVTGMNTVVTGMNTVVIGMSIDNYRALGFATVDVLQHAALILFALFITFSCWANWEEAKSVAGHFLEVGENVMRPIRDGIRAVFAVLSRPGNLLSYAITIMLMTWRVEIGAALDKAVDRALSKL